MTTGYVNAVSRNLLTIVSDDEYLDDSPQTRTVSWFTPDQTSVLPGFAGSFW